MELNSFTYTICVPTDLTDISQTISCKPWITKDSEYTFIIFDTLAGNTAVGSWLPDNEDHVDLPVFNYRCVNPLHSNAYKYTVSLNGNNIISPRGDGIKYSKDYPRIIGIHSPLMPMQFDYTLPSLFEGMGINIENSPINNVECSVCIDLFSQLKIINLEKAFYNVMLRNPPVIGYKGLQVTSLKNFWKSAMNRPIDLDSFGIIGGDFTKCVSVENAFADSKVYGFALPVIEYLISQNKNMKTKGCFKNCEDLTDYDKIPSSWK